MVTALLRIAVVMIEAVVEEEGEAIEADLSRIVVDVHHSLTPALIQIALSQL